MPPLRGQGRLSGISHPVMAIKIRRPLTYRIKLTLAEGWCERVNNLYRKTQIKNVLMKIFTVFSDKVQLTVRIKARFNIDTIYS